jgi:uncharacterized membrane protein
VEETMLVRLLITVLCGVGLYASLFMLAKSRRAAKGLLQEPSVVQSPRARLLWGIPNSAVGVAYYPLVALAVWLLPANSLLPALVLAAAAAAMSFVLAYSLLFITKMPCPFCWTSHGINWSLLVLLWLLHR